MERNIHKQETFDDHVQLFHKKHPIFLICDEINDPKNIGAILRLADAANIEKVIFITDNPPESFYKIDKVARSTRQVVSHSFSNCKELNTHLPEDIQWVAIEITNKSIPVKDFVPKSALALVLGNEGNGVSEQFLKKCQTAVHIPMYGQNSSMNVSMAAAIVIYDLIEKF